MSFSLAKYGHSVAAAIIIRERILSTCQKNSANATQCDISTLQTTDESVCLKYSTIFCKYSQYFIALVIYVFCSQNIIHKHLGLRNTLLIAHQPSAKSAKTLYDICMAQRLPLKARLRRYSWVRRLLPTYHFWRAVLANCLYLFPARNMKVIAVTGTNGKTTTASYIASILEADGKKVGVSSTAYYRIGDQEIVNDTNMTVIDPFKLSHLLFKMRLKGVKWLVLEVTAHSLTQNRIWGIPIHAAVMTNLTQDHLDYYGTMKEYAAAKALLFQKKPPLLVLNRDDEWFEYYDSFPAKSHKINFGTHPSASCRITKAKLGKTGSNFEITVDTVNTIPLQTSQIGKFNVYNATAAAAVAYLLHIDHKTIAKGIAQLSFVAGRMEFVPNKRNLNIVVDYAHTPVALQGALETIRSTTTNRLLLVFGATGDRDRKKRPDMGEIAAQYADAIFVTDEEPYFENPAKIRAGLMQGITKGRGLGKTSEVADRREAIKKALYAAQGGDSVLITGMGHQEFMTVEGEKLPWNDVQVVQEILQELASESK